MLKVGDIAPPFMERAADGRLIALHGFQGSPLILYFFPKAFTPTCTVETKGFRDNYGDLRALGFEVVGVSTDTPETQCRFAGKLGVEFPMLADTRGDVSKTYGVLWPLLPYARRVTYVLDDAHRVVAIFHHEFQANRHLDEVMAFARKWGAEKQSRIVARPVARETSKPALRAGGFFGDLGAARAGAAAAPQTAVAARR